MLWGNMKKNWNNEKVSYRYVNGILLSYWRWSSKQKINNALKTFAQGMDSDTIIGFYDTTSFGSGKNGYIFTDDKMYYVEMFENLKSCGMTILSKYEC